MPFALTATVDACRKCPPTECRCDQCRLCGDWRGDTLRDLDHGKLCPPCWTEVTGLCHECNLDEVMDCLCGTEEGS